jgi:hypothetical protein
VRCGHSDYQQVTLSLVEVDIALMRDDAFYVSLINISLLATAPPFRWNKRKNILITVAKTREKTESIFKTKGFTARYMLKDCRELCKLTYSLKLFSTLWTDAWTNDRLEKVLNISR